MRTGFAIPGGLMLGLLDCVTGDTVAITANRATVAQWRQARAEAIYRDDVWSLQVFKAATVFLEEAERYGLADDPMFCCNGSPKNATPPRCAWSAVTTTTTSEPATTTRQ